MDTRRHGQRLGQDIEAARGGGPLLVDDMCGIVGLVDRAGAVDAALLERMRQALTHRGPDSAGSFVAPERTAAFGHCRLAILDLSAAGSQPMADASGRYWITFNGEIYNHRELRRELEAAGTRLRSHSDTEVLIEAFALWGERALHRLNGMFAFALLDRAAGRLLLARDRAGEKPLYYAQGPGWLSFASELSPLLLDPRIPRQLDAVALEDYLARGYSIGERSLVHGVRRLPPAGLLKYDIGTGESTVHRYWQLPRPAHGHMAQRVGEAALTADLRSLLQHSVRLRLEADVPVGVLLSGGVDSSLVAAAAVQVSSRPVDTFTVGFPTSPAHDERRHARLVAQYLGTRHHEIEVAQKTEDLLQDLLSHLDEPLADSSLVPTYAVSRLAREHVKVALAGDGGDELFGGYVHYRTALAVGRVTRFVPPVALRAAGALVQDVLPIGFPGRHFVGSLRPTAAERASRLTRIFAEHDLHQLLGDALRRQPGPTARSGSPGQAPVGGREVPAAFLGNGDGRSESECPADAMMRQDFAAYLPDDLLTKVDRASMAVGLEVRAPWLDTEIIEFAFGSVPAALKVKGGRLKHLPKLLAAQVLPPQLEIERKQGFSLPVAQWLLGAWRTPLLQGTSALVRAGVVRQRAVDQLIAGQARGYANAPRLYALMVLGIWMERFQMSL